MIGREVGGGSDFSQSDGSGVMRVDEIHTQLQAPEQLPAGAGAPRRDQACRGTIIAMQNNHALQQEVELILVPRLISEPALRVAVNEAQYRADQAVVVADPFGELDRAPPGPVGLIEQCLRREPRTTRYVLGHP